MATMRPGIAALVVLLLPYVRGPAAAVQRRDASGTERYLESAAQSVRGPNSSDGG